MRGDAGPSNPNRAAAATLKIQAYEITPTTEVGGNK
jgi:hypothetical protein